MKSISDRALILRRHPYSESSLVVSALSRQHGLVQILARGAYRPRSRYYAVLDVFHELELEWIPAKRSDLATLKSGGVRLTRRGLTQDLQTYSAGLSLLELAGLGARPGQRETQLYDCLSDGLDGLNLGGAPDGVLVRFELAFLQLHGLFPALKTCASCSKAAPASGRPARVGFSAGAGGRLCQACLAEVRAGGGRVGTLPLDVLAAAAKISDGEQIPGSPEILVRVRDFVERFLDYHLGTRPRSHRTFLSADNRNAPRPLAGPTT